MRPMTPHEKECAMAAVALLLEKASRNEQRELRALYREILNAPLDSRST